MKVLIDTSSLLSLVRYYLPFDNNEKLFNKFKEEYSRRQILVLDKVYQESKYVSKGIITKELDFLNDKKLHIKTDHILPSKKFFNQLENQFCNAIWKNQLSEVEFENRKASFLNSADAKIILTTLEYKAKWPLDSLSVVTEETLTSNDNKAFKKLPMICKILDINYITLPDFLKSLDGLDIEFI